MSLCLYPSRSLLRSHFKGKLYVFVYKWGCGRHSSEFLTAKGDVREGGFNHHIKWKLLAYVTVNIFSILSNRQPRTGSVLVKNDLTHTTSRRRGKKKWIASLQNKHTLNFLLHTRTHFINCLYSYFMQISSDSHRHIRTKDIESYYETLISFLCTYKYFFAPNWSTNLQTVLTP